MTTYLAGERDGIPRVVAFGLFQIAEVSVVLAWLGWRSGLLDADIYSLLLAVILIMLLLTPFVLRLAQSLRQLITVELE